MAKGDEFLKPAALNNEKLSKLKALNEIAQERGQTLAQMALAWLLHHKDVTSVLIGASKTEQLLDNINAAKNTLFTKEELEKIENIALR